MRGGEKAEGLGDFLRRGNPEVAKSEWREGERREGEEEGRP
jgi:hypothetical protein